MRKLTTEDVKRRLDSGDDLIFIDARSADSWSKADQQIPNSLRLPPDQSDRFDAPIPRGATIITYCT